MTRGVLYITWPGDARAVAALDRSVKSLQRVHPGMPMEVMRLPEGANLLDKSQMAELSPFDTTLFLDADTVVLGDLSYGFESAERHGLACCICECPWARRYPALSGDDIEYNTGVLFWTAKARPVFDRWAALAKTIDSSIHWNLDGRNVVMPFNDQAGFALAVKELAYVPYVLPMNWNLRPVWHRSWFGPVKVWHDYGTVPMDLLKRNAEVAPATYVQLGN